MIGRKQESRIFPKVIAMEDLNANKKEKPRQHSQQNSVAAQNESRLNLMKAFQIVTPGKVALRIKNNYARRRKRFRFYIALASKERKMLWKFSQRFWVVRGSYNPMWRPILDPIAQNAVKLCGRMDNND